MRLVKKLTIALLVIVVILSVGIFSVIDIKSFGRLPEGARLERIMKSPNYSEGEFKNLTETQISTSDKSVFKLWLEFVFRTVENLKPSHPLPSIKQDLKSLPDDKNYLVWFGHSSYLINLDGKKILVDPVFVSGSPVSFLNKMFKGSNVFSPSDMPEIDILVITHDHWDHLDYWTLMELKPHVKQIVTSLGVGSHLEYWDFPLDQILELDWNDTVNVDGFTITSLPARHFSGRGFTRNKTLWSSFMIQGKDDNIFVGGDSGYDDYYYEIAKKFPKIDLAIMENGQYNKDWANIHILPEELAKVVKILNPKKFMAVHNSKFALSRHTWKEPLELISANSQKYNLPLVTPKIGEVLYFDTMQTFSKWWEDVN